MTSLSRTVLGLSCTATVAIIGWVHYRQYEDREQLHLGVVRDIERQERLKRQNILALQRQIGLTRELQSEQDAKDTTKT